MRSFYPFEAIVNATGTEGKGGKTPADRRVCGAVFIGAALIEAKKTDVGECRLLRRRSSIHENGRTGGTGGHRPGSSVRL